jgi:hypothetical protein
MEQMMKRLLDDMKTQIGSLASRMDVSQEKMDSSLAEIKTTQEKTDAGQVMMEVNQKKAKVLLEAMRSGREEMRASTSSTLEFRFLSCQKMANLIVHLSIRRCQHEFMNVTMWEHCTLAS